MVSGHEYEEYQPVHVLTSFTETGDPIAVSVDTLYPTYDCAVLEDTVRLGGMIWSPAWGGGVRTRAYVGGYDFAGRRIAKDTVEFTLPSQSDLMFVHGDVADAGGELIAVSLAGVTDTSGSRYQGRLMELKPSDITAYAPFSLQFDQSPHNYALWTLCGVRNGARILGCIEGAEGSPELVLRPFSELGQLEVPGYRIQMGSVSIRSLHLLIHEETAYIMYDVSHGVDAESGVYVMGVPLDRILSNSWMSRPIVQSFHVQVYPNPFNARTTIQFSLSEAGPVLVTVHDVLGRSLGVVLSTNLSPGFHTIPWSAQGQASGTYFLVVQAAGQTAANKLQLIR